MFWKLNILRIRPTIILSSSNIRTLKARKKGLCLSSKMRMEKKIYQNNSRLPNTILFFIFCQFLVTVTISSKLHLWIHFPSAPRKTSEYKCIYFLLTRTHPSSARSNYFFYKSDFKPYMFLVGKFAGIEKLKGKKQP